MKNSLITLTMVSLIMGGCASTNEVVNTNEIIPKPKMVQKDFNNETALHDAVRARDLKIVQFFINQKSELNSKNINGYTPLHIAVRLQEYEIAKLLIENGALINTIDKYKDTPLLDSTRDNYTKVSKLLICNGANRDVVDTHAMSPLHNSSKNNNEEVTEMLKAEKLDPYCELYGQIKPESDKEVTNAVVFVGLYDALMEEFKDDFEPWNAELTKDDLTFRFSHPLALFEIGKSKLKVGFTDILSDFFPRYVKIVNKYKSKINEIRIEGHTSSEYQSARNDEERYLLNEKLSIKRANEARNYTVNESSKNSEIDKDWLENTFKAYGMSSSDLIMNPDGIENFDASRRVDFKITRITQ